MYGLAFDPGIDDLPKDGPQVAREMSVIHDGPLLAVEPNIHPLPDDMGIELVRLNDAYQPLTYTFIWLRTASSGRHLNRQGL